MPLDTVLLLICMKLLVASTHPQDVVIPLHEVYDKAKRCLAHAEMNGALSNRLLQASVLLTMHEMSHAIYPAAYLRVGYCSRVGYALGIHDRKLAYQMIPSPSMHQLSQGI
jgi:hypothetical protein